VLIAHLRSARSPVSLLFSGVPLQRAPFSEILKVGVPALINTGITNLSLVILTGIAGRLSRETAIGYAMRARLEYILILLAFGFGAPLSPWSAPTGRQGISPCPLGCLGRRRDGCGNLHCNRIDGCPRAAVVDGLVQRRCRGRPIGSDYLRIVGPIYGFYGLGMALFFAAQGFGRAVLTVAANSVRLLGSAADIASISATGFFCAVALGFVSHAVLTAYAVTRVNEPAAENTAERPVHQASNETSLHLPVMPIYFCESVVSPVGGGGKRSRSQ
jgi:hypothetical protein